MNEPLKMLYDEHDVILSAIEMMEPLSQMKDTNPERYEKVVSKLITFLREYADKFHHHKEEIILFPEMGQKNELLPGGIIQEMLDNHSDFRDMIGGIEANLESRNFDKCQRILEAYVEALRDHIAVENEELFQMAESLFSDDELERITCRFQDCDRELGEAYKEELAEIAGLLREELFIL